ncbi:hypothetical protein NSS79_24455 [Paenibacillus sp. FSL L8-0436]|uniref:hypothetical protein n=1 Tax=Paenibacillus sp. FSL L8-0436 TaxID=2954686 RepID=UPI003157F4AF
MKRLYMLVLMTLVIVVLSTGCGTKNNTTNGYKTQSKEQHMIHKADSTRSDKVAKDLSKIRGVDKATHQRHRANRNSPFTLTYTSTKWGVPKAMKWLARDTP